MSTPLDRVGRPPTGPGIDSASIAVADYGDYASAQRAIDYLSDQRFPVEHSAIVGTDLRLVENVLGRLTVGRAAVAGAGAGAWFGLFIGLLFGLFSTYNWFGVVATGVVVGAVWGAIFAGVAHAVTRGRRDFTSRSSLVASRYAILVEPAYADQARQLITRLNWQTQS
jgi:hypothetical protein